MALEQMRVYNGLIPKKGPLQLRVKLDFTNVASIDFDTVSENENAVFEGIQSAYVDNRNNPSPLVLIVTETGHHIVWPAFSAGWLPVLQSGVAHINAATSIGVVVVVHFVNVYMPPIMYAVV